MTLHAQGSEETASGQCVRIALALAALVVLVAVSTASGQTAQTLAPILTAP